MECFLSKLIICRCVGSFWIDYMSGVKLYIWVVILIVKYDENLFFCFYVDRIFDKKVMIKVNIIVWEY